jgi:membrane protease YdiL (CAAX protease family)
MIEILFIALITGAVSYLIYKIEAHPRKPMNIDYFSHPFKKYKEGAFSVMPPYTIDPNKFLIAGFLLIFAPLVWVLFNIPEAFRPALLYVILSLLTIIIGFFELLFPIKFEPGGMVGFGGEEYETQILVGIGIGFLTSMMFLFVRNSVESSQVLVLPISPITIFFTLVIAPFIEEWFFGNILPASLMEEMGWVGGTILSCVSFALMHFLAYNASLSLMAVVFAFRFMTCIAMLKWVSFLPGLAGHFVANLLSIIFSV